MSDCAAPPDIVRPLPTGGLRWLWPTVVTLGIALVVVARMAPLGRPFHNDSGAFIGMGKLWIDGGTPYVDLWDTKLPGVVLMGGVLYKLLGSAWWAYLALQATLAVAAAAILAATARTLTVDASPLDRRRVGRATFAAGLVLLNQPRLLGDGFQLETPQLFFASVAAWLLAKGMRAEPRPILGPRALLFIAAGVVAGIGALSKPTGLSVVGAGAFVLLLQGTRRRRLSPMRDIAAICLGVLLVVAAIVAWTFQTGIAETMPYTLREISLYGSATPWSQIVSGKTALLVALTLAPAVAAFWAAPKHHAPGKQSVLRIGGWFTAAWILLELVGIVVQKRGYAYHFLPLGAPTTLAVGLAFLSTPSRGRRWRSWATLGPLALIVLAGIGPLLRDWRASLTLPSELQSIRYLKDHTDPDDALFGDNVGRLSVMTDRPVGGRLVQMVQLVNHDEAPRRYMDQLLSDLKQRRPAFMILRAPWKLEGEIARWEEQPVLAENPRRRIEYREAWERYLEWVDLRYERVAELDALELLRRRDDWPAEEEPAAVR